jgi:hypothetical protein
VIKIAKLIITDRFFDGYNFQEGIYIIVINNGIITKLDKVDESVEIKGIKKDDERIEDLRGYTLTPGIIDSHNHFTLTALKLKFQINLSGVSNFKELKTTLLNNSDKYKDGWILGFGLNEFNLAEQKLPTVKDLDEISLDSPIYLAQSSEHYAVCNSTALKIAGINKNTKIPFGGSIGRDEKGELNGILYEEPAMDMVLGKIPDYSLKDYEDSLLYTSKLYRLNGLTTVKDTGDVDEEKRITALNNLSENGDLAICVCISIPINSREELQKKIALSEKIRENNYFKFTGFKLFMDGSSLSRTAWVKNVWNKNYTEVDNNNFGTPLWKLEDFYYVVSELAKLNKTISIHTVGDRAISTAIDAIKQNRSKSQNFALVHCYIPSDEDLKDIKDLGISIETQAAFLHFLGGGILSNLGESRGNRLFPYKYMIDNEINVCNGSDSPITPFEPAYGIVSAMKREVMFKGKKVVLNKEQCLSLEETLKSYTSNCAKALKLDNLGKIAVGALADFTVWKKIPSNFEEITRDNLFYDVILHGKSVLHNFS